jgi:hypothetical protein
MLGGTTMPMEEEPVIGAMYEDEDGLAFEVVSFDEDEGIIEVQYEDGEVSEIDIDSWYELDLQKLKSRAWKDDEEEEDEAETPSPKLSTDLRQGGVACYSSRSNPMG